MQYQCTLLIPALTAQANPARATISLGPGIISKVSIIFPPGCAGLAHIQILHKEHLLFPSSPDENYIGDTFPIEWIEYFPLNEGPYELTVIGWNTDTLYSHSPMVRFEMLSKAKTLGDYFKRLFGASDLSG